MTGIYINSRVVPHKEMNQEKANNERIKDFSKHCKTLFRSFRENSILVA
jgi:hypothetical protein